ncbi:MAG: phosphate signaling complex protein PhoU [Actinobacteria bacterium]|nr:phosphate signaling complex protein PhoU [Actinomycetota bacterium]
MTARLAFDEQLKLLNSELTNMAAMVERAIEGAAVVVQEGDAEGAQKIIDSDGLINTQERDIERLCLKLLLQQQPVASDLRNISAALKMITDLERIGDQAADICEIVMNLPKAKRLLNIEHLPKMAKTTSSMVHCAIAAFVESDIEKVNAVLSMDDEVDALFDAARDEIVADIRQGGPNESEAMDFLMIAKYFERIGDHAENIAEWAEYSINGIHKGHQLYQG